MYYLLHLWNNKVIFKNLLNEIDSIIDRDPAAGSRVGVVFLYPTFHVMLF